MPKSSHFQRSQNFTSCQIILSGNVFYSNLNIVNKPTSNIYFEKLKIQLFIGINFTCHRVQQLLALPRVLFNIKFLITYFFFTKNYTFGITNTGLCFFCNTLEEIPIHIFFDCVHVECLWERLRMKFQNDFILLSLKPQTTILGLYNEANDKYNLLGHILLIFKYIYISREKRTLNIDILIANLLKVKKREKQISIVTINKRETCKKSCALQVTFYQ